MNTSTNTHQTYSKSFKVAAIRLAEHPGFQTQDVALALAIHPFMLSRWKKEYRDSLLKGNIEESLKVMKDKVQDQKTVRELEKRIKKLEEENELLKKKIPFFSKQKKKSSRT